MQVDGFQGPGSFSQRIHYAAGGAVVRRLVETADSCSQQLRYDCRQSRLLGNTSGDTRAATCPADTVTCHVCRRALAALRLVGVPPRREDGTLVRGGAGVAAVRVRGAGRV